MAVMVTWSASLGANDRSALTARSQNSSTASEAGSSGGIGWTRSPDTASGSRLVASTVTVGHPATTAPTNSTTGASTCSQLSIINNRRRPRNQSTIEATMVMPGWGWIDNVDATEATTPAGSPAAAKSISHTPPTNSSTINQAISMANRVLPTPPGPVNVTNRRFARPSTPCCSSATRPTNSVAGRGRFPDAPSAVANGTSTHPRWSARTPNTCIASAKPFKRCEPRSTSSIPAMRPNTSTVALDTKI